PLLYCEDDEDFNYGTTIKCLTNGDINGLEFLFLEECYRHLNGPKWVWEAVVPNEARVYKGFCGRMKSDRLFLSHPRPVTDLLLDPEDQRKAIIANPQLLPLILNPTSLVQSLALDKDGLLLRYL